jgi:hypothetical protein
VNGDRRLTRRGAARLLAGLAGLATVLPEAGYGGPRDQGIGGTGVRFDRDPDDRGIGGTGIIGTIQRFGSIFVNDLRIVYPDTAVVSIDGRPAAIGDLRIGHVVRVEASRRKGRLSTAVIEVESEVAGPIERLSSTMMTVLGQSVVTDAIKNGADWRVGDEVAVSGLRRPDGAIVASFLEARPQGPMRIAGPVERAFDERLTIGDLTLVGVDPSLVGHRAILEGYLANGAFQTTRSIGEASLFGRRVRRLSIEAYVARSVQGLRLGSGLRVVGGKGAIPPSSVGARAVVDLTVGRDGRLIVDEVRPERVRRSGGGSAGPGGPGPGGPGPGPGGPGSGPGVGPGGPGPGVHGAAPGGSGGPHGGHP